MVMPVRSLTASLQFPRNRLLACCATLAVAFAGAQSAVAQDSAARQLALDKDDIAGVVTSAQGPEAGVWVIAETAGLATRYAKIVVTDDQGRYLVPGLPQGTYKLWVRGYGLADSKPVQSTPGHRVNLTAVTAPDAATAARVYPAAYWYAMVRLPQDAEIGQLHGGRNEYLMWIKNMGCIGCHQLGNLATRTLEPSLGKFSSAHDAWIRRVQSGQAGRDMVAIAMGQLQGVPLKYLSEWTDRIAHGELPASAPKRPTGAERNVVATVQDWASDHSYLHDLSGTDRRNPTVNGYGPLYGSPELSTDEFPIFDPKRIAATTFHAPVRDANTPSTHDDPVTAPSPYWGDERIWDS
jgi:hypothetical protein